MADFLQEIRWLHDLHLSQDGKHAYLTKSTLNRFDAPLEDTVISIELDTWKLTTSPCVQSTPQPEPLCRIFDDINAFRGFYHLTTPEPVPAELPTGRLITEHLTCKAGTVYLTLAPDRQQLWVSQAGTPALLYTCQISMPEATELDNGALLFPAAPGKDQQALLILMPGASAGDSCPAYRMLIPQLCSLGCSVLWLPVQGTMDASRVLQYRAQYAPGRTALLGTHQGADLAFELLANGFPWDAVIAVDGVVNRLGRMGIHPGCPATAPSRLWADSPLRGAANFHSPTLLFSNPSDFSVGIGEAQQMFQALLDQGTPARMILLQEQDRRLTHPENWQCFLVESVAWLQKYLFSGEGV